MAHAYFSGRRLGRRRHRARGSPPCRRPARRPAVRRGRRTPRLFRLSDALPPPPSHRVGRPPPRSGDGHTSPGMLRRFYGRPSSTRGNSARPSSSRSYEDCQLIVPRPMVRAGLYASLLLRVHHVKTPPRPSCRTIDPSHVPRRQAPARRPSISSAATPPPYRVRAIRAPTTSRSRTNSTMTTYQPQDDTHTIQLAHNAQN